MGPELLKCERAQWFPVPKGEVRKARLGDVVAEVCHLHDVSPDAVMGRCRQQRESAARQEVWRRLFWLGWGYSAIGRAFGRDHTTIMAGVDAAEVRAA